MSDKCPRCGGQLFAEYGAAEIGVSCFQCGWLVDLPIRHRRDGRPRRVLPASWRPVLSPSVRRLVETLWGRETPLAILWDAGPEAILADHGYAWEDVRGPSRLCDVVACRTELVGYYRSRDVVHQEIGRLLGGRHHTTIMPLAAAWQLAHAVATERLDPTAPIRPAVPDAVLTPAQAARRLGTSVGNVRYFIAAGRLPASKDAAGRLWLRAGDLPARLADIRVSA